MTASDSKENFSVNCVGTLSVTRDTLYSCPGSDLGVVDEPSQWQDINHNSKILQTHYSSYLVITQNMYLHLILWPAEHVKCPRQMLLPESNSSTD